MCIRFSLLFCFACCIFSWLFGLISECIMLFGRCLIFHDCFACVVLYLSKSCLFDLSSHVFVLVDPFFLFRRWSLLCNNSKNNELLSFFLFYRPYNCPFAAIALFQSVDWVESSLKNSSPVKLFNKSTKALQNTSSHRESDPELCWLPTRPTSICFARLSSPPLNRRADVCANFFKSRNLGNNTARFARNCCLDTMAPNDSLTMYAKS
jgi:hypothetical protein